MFVSLDAFVSAVSFLSIASKMGQNRKYVRVLQVTRRCDDVANVTENMSEIESASVRGSGKENEKENETWNVSSGKGGITRRQKIQIFLIKTKQKTKKHKKAKKIYQKHYI